MNELIFAPALLFYACISIRKKTSNALLCIGWLLLSPLIIIGFFRDNIGTDWDSYESIFEAVRKDGLSVYTEVGWSALNILASILGSFHWLIFLVYFIILFVIARINIAEKSAIFILAIICLFRFFVYFTRQELSCAILLFFLFALPSFGHNKSIKYRAQGAFVFLPILFHWSQVFPWIVFQVVRSLLPFRLSLVTVCKTFFYTAFVFALFYLVRDLSQLNNVLNQTVEASYEDNLFRLVLKILSIVSLFSPSFLCDKSNRLDLMPYTLTGLSIVIISLGMLVASPNAERLLMLSYPFAIVCMTKSWENINYIHRIYVVGILLAVFMAWLSSPFYAFYFPVRTILGPLI